MLVSELNNYAWVKNSAAPAIAPYIPKFVGHKKKPLENPRTVTAGSQQQAKDLVLYSNVLGFGPRVTLDSELSAGQIVELDLPIAKQYTVVMQIRRRNVYSAVLDRAFEIAEHYFKNLKRT